jgi:hypothetical protein
MVCVAVYLCEGERRRLETTNAASSISKPDWVTVPDAQRPERDREKFMVCLSSDTRCLIHLLIQFNDVPLPFYRVHGMIETPSSNRYIWVGLGWLLCRQLTLRFSED